MRSLLQILLMLIQLRSRLRRRWRHRHLLVSTRLVVLLIWSVGCRVIGLLIVLHGRAGAGSGKNIISLPPWESEATKRLLTIE